LTGEGGIKHDATDRLGRLIGVAAHAARHVATALLDLDLHVELAALGQVRNDLIRVDDLDVVWGLDVTSAHRAFALLAQHERDLVTVVQAEHHALEVQHDVNHVFLNAVHGGILVEHAGDRHLGRRVAHHRRQQHATQRVAQGMAVSPLERLKDHLGTVTPQRFDVDGLGLQQIGLH